ncbi:MAG: MBL fold metallo-hydrolase [Alphaproteobacteria bacterium]|nr:MBL fold metallo-hydrolase [Alphaproteobacteria bacterium]
MKIRLTALGMLAFAGSSLAQPGRAPAPATPEALVNAAKTAAGMDFSGTFLRICVNPQNAVANGAGRAGPGRGAGAAAAPRPAPDRATWYAAPYKVFDNLYFVGTKIHNSWALTTSGGIIIIDTLFDYAIQPEIVDGLTKLGLNPRDVKYVIITHAHGDHDQGAALLQSRYGAHVVMGAADWDSTLARPATAAGGVPRRGPGDISVGPEGYKLTLGDTSVNIIATPGHTPGTISMTFPVKDHGRLLTVAYSGGTAFNFPRTAENFAIYEATQKKMGAAAAAAGATVLMSNHTEFDGAYDKVRLAQLPRAAGEPHPYEVGADAIRRYFEMTADCAESQRLLTK